MRSKPASLGTVAVLGYDAVAMFEFAVACEVFGPSESADLQLPAWYDLVVCGDEPAVRFDNGLRLDVPHGLSALLTADTVVLPPTDRPQAVSERTIAAVRSAHARGARVISLCTGAFILARTGLLDGRRAVTHWSACDALAAAHPSISVDPGVLYVDEGDILTSAGSAASIDLCLHVVRLDQGAEVANRLARSLVVAPHRDGGQAQFIEHPIPTSGATDAFADTLRWMHEHLAEPLVVAELARRAAMSPRSFARRFVGATGTTPHRWLVTRRIHHAQRLLETTDLPVDTVAERSGLGNAANLRKQFHRRVHVSPNAYRSTFRRSLDSAV